MTLEKTISEYARLTKANGFEQVGLNLQGNMVYSKEWHRKTQVVWYGESMDTLEIKTWLSYGIPMVRVFRNGRAEEKVRTYASPKRMINAIAEIARCAGYEMEVRA